MKQTNNLNLTNEGLDYCLDEVRQGQFICDLATLGISRLARCLK